MLRSAFRFVSLLVVLAAFELAPVSAKAAEMFAFEDYFRGQTVAYGKFSAINGAKRRFRVDLYGSWDGKTLKLVEKFRYDDGVRETKTWYFTKTGPGRYTGKRSDVLGEAKVLIRGDTARYGYKLFLDAENRKDLVGFRDKMVLLKDGTVRNTATVFKYGLPVGRVVVNFARKADMAKLKRP